MVIKKEIFINSLEMIKIDESTNIPSIVLFENSGSCIGYQAIEKASDITKLNENFKLNLGEIGRNRKYPSTFETGDGNERNAFEITKVFIENVINSSDRWIRERGLQRAKRIIVAEPLALNREKTGESNDWIANYRREIKDILAPYFDEVNFLPEPFAVFQYYRYGIRHPLLSEQKKHIALVVDFGGGTFDVSIVETTASGDVSASGRNSRPLAAASVSAGGSLLNFLIVKELILKYLNKGEDKRRLEKAFSAYRSGANDSGGFSSLSTDIRTFIRQIKNLVNEIEKAKIHICETLADWSIDAKYEPGPAAKLAIPINPFDENSKTVPVRFDAYILKEIFINKIWKNHLRETIKSAITRSMEELENRPINVILLSGGSANIRWLSKLIEQEIVSLEMNTEIIELQSSFQEIVSKGLAIECARRSYNEGIGDFKAVTYNRLCLVLGADDRPPTAPRFRFLGKSEVDNNTSDGTLLNSAYIFNDNSNTTMRWKFRLESPPKHTLNYYFLKSSLDYEDLSSLYNVDTKVFTPSKTKFDSQIELELTVREDGTAYPKFIYHRGKNENDLVCVNGIPFFMDMTDVSKSSKGEAYIGLDFGTSNSSISYIAQNSIRVFTQRAGDSGWLELNELVNNLPYPVANPLATFLGGATNEELQLRFSEAFEVMLYFTTVLSYIDYCHHKGRKETTIFRSLSKSSAGPLWGMLRIILDKKINNNFFLSRLSRLIHVSNQELITLAIDHINALKHHKKPSVIDYHRVLGLLGNTLAFALEGWKFGLFENVSKVGFGSRYTGIFRVAHGRHAPFIDKLEYSGAESFSELESVIINNENSIVLRLMPFMFWQHNYARQESTVALLDSFCESSNARYRFVDGGGEHVVSSSSLDADLYHMCCQIFKNDSIIENSKLLNLSITEKI